jgi:hypothetical protein
MWTLWRAKEAPAAKVLTQQSFDQRSERTMVLRRRFLGSLFQNCINPKSYLRSLFAAHHKADPSYCNSNVFKRLSVQNGDFNRALDHPTRFIVNSHHPFIVTLTNKVESQDQFGVTGVAI